jgi:HPt (histidine-containing phosphotransfer) domain-containing protein
MSVPTHRQPSDPAHSAVSRALADMRDQFCAGLDDRICRIEAARIALNTDPEAALETVSFEAHRICGVAGSLGLDALSTQARALEERVAAPAGRKLSPADNSDLNAQIEAFLDLLEQHLTDD